MREGKIMDDAMDHFHYSKTVESPFSSWAASLHLVLCYAQSMPAHTDPHVAVMDTQALEGEVLVWHCPDLIGKGDHEFLVYGPIRGPGYRAVSLSTLKRRDILNLFPQLGQINPIEIGFYFGFNCRSHMFDSDESQYPTRYQLCIAEVLAQAFGPLFLPVFLALLHLEPRPWFTARNSGVCIDVEVIQQLANVLDRNGCSDTLVALVGQE